MAEKRPDHSSNSGGARLKGVSPEPSPRLSLWSGAAGVVLSLAYWVAERWAVRAGWVAETVFASRDRAHFDPLLLGAAVFALFAFFPAILGAVRSRFFSETRQESESDSFCRARARWAWRDAWALAPWIFYPLVYVLPRLQGLASAVPGFFLEKMREEGFSAAERMTAYGMGLCFLTLLLFKAFAMFRFLLEIAADEWKTARTGFLALCATVYVFTGFWTSAEYPPTGDEPHYLLMAHSLVFDRDLDLENNYANRDFLVFRDRLEPQIESRGGKRPLKHEIAFSLLIAPAYALGKRCGVVFFLNLLAALAIWQLAELLAQLPGDGKTALLASAAVAFLTPYYIYSSQVFPEIAAALILIVALRLILSERVAKRDGFALLCLGLVVLPLLKARFWLLAVSLVPLAMFLPRQKNRLLLALPILLAAALALFCWMDTRFFGGYAYYGKLRIVLRETLKNLSLDYVRSAAAILFDQGSGLIVYAPILLAAFAGVVPMWKAGPKRCVLFVQLVLLYTIAKSPYWQAGWCPPGRYLICLLPVAAVFLAHALRWGNRSLRFLAGGLAVLSGVILFILTVLPPLRYPLTDGRGVLFAVLDKLSGLPLTSLVPAFSVETDASAWAAGLLLTAGCLLLGFLTSYSPGSNSD